MMKVTIGYITAWRRAVFLAMVLGIVLFGSASTLATAFLGGGLRANLIGVLALLFAILLWLMVYADRGGHFEGEAEAAVSNGHFFYRDKKRTIECEIADITKLDFKALKASETGRTVLAYQIIIKTEKKTYTILSDRAAGRSEKEVDLYRLYTALNEAWHM